MLIYRYVRRHSSPLKYRGNTISDFFLLKQNISFKRKNLILKYNYILGAGRGLPRGPVLPDGPVQVHGGRQGEALRSGGPPSRDHAEHHLQF